MAAGRFSLSLWRFVESNSYLTYVESLLHRCFRPLPRENCFFFFGSFPTRALPPGSHPPPFRKVLSGGFRQTQGPLRSHVPARSDHFSCLFVPNRLYGPPAP